VVIRHGKGGKRREMPIRRERVQRLQIYLDNRRAGPLFRSRQKGSGMTPYLYTRQRIGQLVRQIAQAAGICNRVYPH
jgi:integrase/recombinase XerD